MDGNAERDSPKETQNNAEMLLDVLSHSELRKGNKAKYYRNIISYFVTFFPPLVIFHRMLIKIDRWTDRVWTYRTVFCCYRPLVEGCYGCAVLSICVNLLQRTCAVLNATDPWCTFTHEGVKDIWTFEYHLFLFAHRFWGAYHANLTAIFIRSF